MVKRTFICLLLCLAPLFLRAGEDCYRLVTIPIPENIKLETSGLALLPDGRLAVAIRRGEIWILDHLDDDPATNVTFKLFASGLHEPLGLVYRDGAFYTAQRTELTRLRDKDNDGRADEYITIAKGWGVTGNYHEYTYGPVFDFENNLWLTLNCTIGDATGTNDAWRGWSLKVKPDGTWRPVSGGFRSPSGIGVNTVGDVFASEQQGNWFAAGALVHIRPGVFHGHAAALKFCNLPGATFKSPGALPEKATVVQAAKQIPVLKLPAVWLPYRKMGMSATDVLCDTTEGRFGPFAGQLFVGEFTQSALNRVFLEKVKGEYQGACFPFQAGFQSAVLRLAWGRDGSLFVGQSNRGWNSLGTRSYGLQRLVWTGKTPFEIKTMEARSDGFLLTFTQSVDREKAGPATAYRMTSYTYPYHSNYGGAELETKSLAVNKVTVAADGLSVQLQIEGLREGYIHELRISDMLSATGEPLRHGRAYYTLNRLP
jgi:glucose/arabinose dehydrogenase